MTFHILDYHDLTQVTMITGTITMSDELWKQLCEMFGIDVL